MSLFAAVKGRVEMKGSGSVCAWVRGVTGVPEH